MGLTLDSDEYGCKMKIYIGDQLCLFQSHQYHFQFQGQKPPCHVWINIDIIRVPTGLAIGKTGGRFINVPQMQVTFVGKIINCVWKM